MFETSQQLVSILIVSFNAKKFIKNTLSSCLNQTYKNTEILVLDNGSTDNTVGVIKKIGDDRIRLFENDKNLGAYAGLNYLLDEAKGDYIAIQDHDDIWLPTKLQKQIDFLGVNKDFVGCGTNTFYYFEDRELLIVNHKPLEVDFVEHTSLVFRNENYHYAQDYILADLHFEKEVLAKDGKIACLSDILLIHRIRKDKMNLSRRRAKFSIKTVLEYFKLTGLRNSGDLMSYLLSPYTSDWLLWRIREKLTFRNAEWLNAEEYFDNVNIKV